MAHDPEKLSVGEYAKARGMQPQLVYYYIRQGYVEQEPCICGRKVIDVKKVDEYIQSRKKGTDDVQEV